MYKLVFSERAKSDLAKLKKNEPNTFNKASKILAELQEHPQTGTGQPERSKYYEEETWSGRFSGNHRRSIASMMSLSKCFFYRLLVTTKTKSLE